MNQIFRFVNQENAFMLQRDMAPKVDCVDDPGFNPRLVCGIDVSYDGDTGFVAAAVWDVERRLYLENITAKAKTSTRYVPGLLGFREGPLLAGISRKLQSRPDVFLVDGHGVAHPRRFGLACQFGIAIDHPTVGVAKSLLYGRPENGMVVDPQGNNIGGIITTTYGKRFYVSIGHRVSLETACRLVKDCILDGHPAPLRKAHIESQTLRRRELL